ncbi:MAG: (2Fe-2S)-binding protein [Proteobacteria bacterium]|nr:MAG: (2Fe-2S)-binding protein [Pseudomonadota bacterium]
MIICVCKNVSDRQIAREAGGGCASFRELQARTGLGTGCGSCVDHAMDCFSTQRACARAEAAVLGSGAAVPAL